MPLQARLGSVNPNREPVLLAAGDLRADERPLHPATKAHQDVGVVVEATSGHEGAQVRTQGLDVTARHELEQILGVSTDVAHATTEAGPCRIGSPGGLPVAAALQRLHQPVLGVFDHDLATLAQLPATHHLTRLAYGGS